MIGKLNILVELFFRLKIPFLAIFFLMTFNYLDRYSFGNNQEIIKLSLVFTLMNFGLHLLNNYYDKIEDEITNQNRVLKSSNLIFIIGVLSIITSLGFVLFYKYSLVCFFTLFLLMFSYSYPFTSKWRIKKVLFVKNITGSLFWWYIPFVLIVSSHTDNSFIDIFMNNLLTLVIFMPFEPLWDIKDMNGDLAVGTKTIPNQFGIPTTKMLVVGIFLTIGLLLFQSKSMFVLTFILPLILMVMLLNETNKLLFSRIIIVFLPLHILISLFLK